MGLEKFSFYNQLEPDAKDYLRMRAQPVEAPKDTILFFQGDVCDSVFLLTEGAIELISQTQDEDILTLYKLEPGKQCIVNTASTLSATEAIATAVATTDIQGFILDIYSLKDLAQKSEAYQSYLFSLYSLQLDAITKLIDSKVKKLDTKVLDWLYAQNAKEVQITSKELASKVEIAEDLLLTILKSFENDNIIELYKNKIVIKTVV
ncbi:MAG: Crp/Fnr family transcriptional regulator [Epsilonproteobacteria bacterium]|nr:Crp/Fnr family transcriptional regulator [Campylobacterota bacterium]